MATSDGKKTILSIDGGGVRGLIPAMVLADLETRLQANGKTKPIYKYFDLIAGTSTGGIIVAGLCAPKPDGAAGEPAMVAAQLVQLYRKHGRKIFQRDRFRGLREAFLNFDLDALSQEKYDAEYLEQVLDDNLGDTTLRQALTNIVITAYDIDHRETKYLRGGPEINALDATNEVAADFYFASAARATSAAPTYFEPERVNNLVTGDVLTLIDGGVFANQPAICAYAQARALGWSAAEVRILSLGTGYQTRSFKFNDAKSWGPINWISPATGSPIINILMHGQADSTEWHMQQFLGPAYSRIDGHLTKGKGNDDLDDASPGNLRALTNLTHEIIRDHDDVLNEWVGILTTG